MLVIFRRGVRDLDEQTNRGMVIVWVIVFVNNCRDTIIRARFRAILTDIIVVRWCRVRDEDTRDVFSFGIVSVRFVLTSEKKFESEDQGRDMKVPVREKEMNISGKYSSRCERYFINF